MKFGVLGFSYNGFNTFSADLADRGSYSINLGDNAQSIAARHVYRQLGVDDADMATLDRDTLTSYDGPPATLIMNGVFWAHHLPTPPQVRPIFVGFRVNHPAAIRQHRDWLAAHQPIGCRDPATAAWLTKVGIEAFVTGCITMCLPPRPAAPQDGKLFVVFGEKAGHLPAEILQAIPDHLLRRTEYIAHRLPVFQYPLSTQAMMQVEQYEHSILNRYRDEAALVVTSLLHVASPCLGLNVPVVLCRKDRDARFGLLETKIPLYTPDCVREVDWVPSIPDVRPDAARIVALVGQALG